MANVSITQLPTAQTLTGSESVPVVQNGVTVQTTTGAIANSPVLTQTFLTVGAQPSLGNSRYFTVGPGMATVDGGSAGPFSANLIGAPLALVTSPLGFQVKTATNTLEGRTFQTGNGLAVTNPDGIAGDPLISLTGIAAAIAGSSGTGMLAIVGGTAIANRTIEGTTNQITVANGNGAGNPAIGLASNPVLPGVAGVVVPAGTNADRPTFPAAGTLRYNSQMVTFEGYTAAGWGAIVAGDAVTLIDTGTGLTGGPITSSGTISIADTAVTPDSYGSTTQVGQFTVNGQGQITAASNVAISVASIGAVASVTGTANEVTATGTTNVVVSLPGALTFTGKTVTGGTFDMLAATVGADTVTTNTALQTLTNKSISGATNTLTAIPNIALDNSSVTFNGVAVALGAAGTITATATNALTIGTGLTGGSYNGSSATTIAINGIVVTLDDAQTLTNKTLTAPIISTISNTGTLTLPTTTDTLVGRDTTDTLTNKTLTSPTVNTPILSGGSINNAIIGASAPAAATFTSATLTSGTIATTPTNGLDIVNKDYADSIASGLNYHAPAIYASTTALPAYTYNNGASGVGATITATTNGALSIGGGSPTTTQRVLVKDEAGGNAPYNGVYTVTATGSPTAVFQLTRAADYDTGGTGANQIDAGDYVLVISGTNASTAWVQQTSLPIIVGTTPLVFLQFNQPITYSAGTGLNLSPATTFNISNTGVTAATYGAAATVPVFAVNAQGQVTSVTDTAIAIANTAVSGLGTMSTQAASAVVITGGSINGTTVGATTASTGAFTTLSATSTVSGVGFSAYLASPPAIGGTAAAAITGTLITASTSFTGALNGTVGATTPASGAFTALSASSTVSGAGFSTYLASPPAIGGTTPGAGAFTTLSASSTATFNTFVSSGVTITGGTINGTTIGATTATTGNFTTVTATSGISGGTF